MPVLLLQCLAYQVEHYDKLFVKDPFKNDHCDTVIFFSYGWDELGQT